MIISASPMRISLFGGSTDYRSYFEKHNSLLIGFAIDKYVYSTLRYTPKIFNYRTCVYCAKIEHVDNNSLIENPAVRGTLEFLKCNDPLEILHFCDLPSQTGLGSSSAFIVSLLNTMHQLKHGCPESKENLATHAILIEREEILKEKGGWQDSIWSSFGNLASIRINTKGIYKVRPLPICDSFIAELHNSLVLFYLGKTRDSFKISSSHDTTKSKHKIAIQQIAEEALIAFADEDLDTIGKLLDKSWEQKRQISPLISTPRIDDLYKQAKKYGILGGKILGAGGDGGFLLCLTHDRDRLINNVKLDHIDFNFDFEGSKIILN